MPCMFLLAAEEVLVALRPAVGPYAATLLFLRVGLKGGQGRRKMADEFTKQLRKQFALDIVLEQPAFVAAVYENERDYAADLIEELTNRNSELEAAINDWHYAIVDWEGCDFIERISNPTYRKVIEDVVNAYAALEGEKKDV